LTVSNESLREIATDLNIILDTSGFPTLDLLSGQNPRNLHYRNGYSS